MRMLKGLFVVMVCFVFVMLEMLSESILVVWFVVVSVLVNVDSLLVD